MPHRRALLNDEAVPANVRPAPHMSVLPYAAVRRMARHTWFHDPVFPSVHLAGLRPRRPAGADGQQRLALLGHGPVRTGSQTVPTIRLVARLASARHITSVASTSRRHAGGTVRPALSGHMRRGRREVASGRQSLIASSLWGRLADERKPATIRVSRYAGVTRPQCVSNRSKAGVTVSERSDG
jgi:hypothetical protein